MSTQPLPRLRIAAIALVCVAALTSVHALPASTAAEKKPLSVEDYTRWRSINSPEISGDGAWVAYVLQLTNTVPAQAKPELHIV